MGASPEDLSLLSRPAAPPDDELTYGGAASHVADVWPGAARAARRPLFVLVHGGFWSPRYDRTHLRPMAAKVRDLGWTVVSVEYRRQAGHPGLATADLAEALRVLPPRLAGCHNGRVVVAGHSAGGHLALWSASQAPAPGLIATLALAPLASLDRAHRLGLGGGAVLRFLGGTPAERPGYDPMRLPSPTSPVVLLRAEHDGLVPAEVAGSYAEAHPCRLRTVAGARHFSLVDPDHWASAIVVAELDALSRRTPGPADA